MKRLMRVGHPVQLESGIAIGRESTLIERGEVVAVEDNIAEQFLKDAGWRQVKIPERRGGQKCQ